MASGRSREFGQPIPPDDGIETVCYQLEIPDTSEWRVLLHTLVLIWTRGRYWKRTKTGREIKDVQATGWEIYNTLKLCDEQEDCPDPTEIEVIRHVKEVICMTCTCGCDCPQPPQLDVENIEDVFPIEREDPPPPPLAVPPPHATHEDEKCWIAKHILVLLSQAIDGMRNFVEIGEANYGTMIDDIRSILGGVKGGIAYSRLWVIYQAFVLAMLSTLSEAIAAGLTTWIDTNRGRLIDAMFCGGDSVESQTNFADVVWTSTGLSLIQKWVFNVWIGVIPFEALYQTSLEVITAPDFDFFSVNYTADCTCAVDGSDLLLPAGYVAVPMLVSGVTNVNGGTFMSVGNLWQFIGGGDAGNDLVLFDPVHLSLTVPNAAIAGFHFELIINDQQQGDSFGHNLANSSTQFTDVSFGAAPGNWLVGETFAGAIAVDTVLQQWLVDIAPRHIDATALTNTDRRVTRFLHYGGDTGNPPLSTSCIIANWIIDTSML